MLDESFQKISDLGGGIPIDQVRFISSILLTYPIAYAYRYLPNSPTLKHFANIAITIFLLLGIHGQTAGFFHLLFSCFITYSILLFAKPDNAPKLIFIWAMGHMSYT
jgi:lysophospholipid acyltransferase